MDEYKYALYMSIVVSPQSHLSNPNVVFCTLHISRLVTTSQFEPCSRKPITTRCMDHTLTGDKADSVNGIYRQRLLRSCRSVFRIQVYSFVFLRDGSSSRNRSSCITI